MKELRKTNALDNELLVTVNMAHCPSLSDGCPKLKCDCRGADAGDSLDKEDDILF